MSDTTPSLFDLLSQKELKTDGKYISQEFQDFAYRLAMTLSTPQDRKTIEMCMRLVKQKPRALLEQTLQFVQDAPARNKVALFLWKMKQIEEENKPASVSQEKKRSKGVKEQH